jgi:integrase
MTFGDVLAVFKQRLQDNPEVKPKTKEYYKFRISALLKSWPDLENKDVSRITNSECLDWSVKSANKNSSSSHNHTVSILRKVFAIAMETGARYDNPALSAQRTRERTKKQIKLPEFEQFEKLVAEVGRPVNGFAKPAADLTQFLAFGGLRIGEAKFVTWGDCDFKRGEIIVRGNPETGLKGRHAGESRIIPMIPDMRKLLERVRSERPDESQDKPIMRVWECQKSIDRASKLLGLKRITHHDLRHLFATRCIESGVDVPTVSRWLGHKDGGALAMKTYGHLRNEHSQQMAQKVRFSVAQA